VLPKGSRRRRDWVTDELRNAWLRVRNVQSQQDQERRKAEYRRVRKLSKAAAERARNSWWSSRAEDAERLASAAERSGRGGSLIKELKLLGVSVAKASTTPVLSSDKTPLTNTSCNGGVSILLVWSTAALQLASSLLNPYLLSTP
jgi:hypothetical protein